jgi:hypothetical protein
MPRLSPSNYIGPEHDGEIGTAETPELVMACAFCGSGCTARAEGCVSVVLYLENRRIYNLCTTHVTMRHSRGTARIFV